MAYSLKAKFGSVRLVAFGSLTNTYAALGSALSENVRVLTFKNTTDADVYVSMDGTTDNVRIPAKSGDKTDFTTNQINNQGFWLPIGTQIYVKYASAPTEGNFWVEEIYGTFV